MPARERAIHLTGDVAFVTGAGGGMGRGIARALAKWGARVALADINADAVAETLREVEADGGEGQAYPLDITSAEEVKQVIKACVDEFGGIDLLVNAAGILIYGSVADSKPADWYRVMDVNINGIYLVSREVTKAMIARGTPASIVSISSSAGRKGEADMASYTASKFGVIGFTQTLAHELVGHDIMVNAICPGNVESQMLVDLADGMGWTMEQMHDYQLIKRFLTGEDMAYSIAFLHTSRVITGQAVNTDGGMMFN